MSSNFIDRCLQGEFEHPDRAIDDYVHRWHMGEGDGVPLVKWLGMTIREYNLWAIDPRALSSILAERRKAQ